MPRKSRSAKLPRRANKNRREKPQRKALDGTELPRLIQEREYHENHKHNTGSSDLITKMQRKNSTQRNHEHEVFVEALHYWCEPSTD